MKDRRATLKVQDTSEFLLSDEELNSELNEMTNRSLQVKGWRYTCGASHLQRNPSSSVCSVQDELVLVQRAVHLHLVTTAIAEVTRYTLTAEEEEM